MKYRKKPVVIEAIQWTNNNLDEVLEFAYERSIVVNGELFLETLEGRMKANVGDFLIKGIKGEVYPCKPDIFEATYERVE
jgi:hypothetical protein